MQKMKALSKKALKHTKIYTGSLKTELHQVPSHTNMDFITRIFLQKITQEQLLNFTRTKIHPVKFYYNNEPLQEESQRLQNSKEYRMKTPFYKFRRLKKGPPNNNTL